MAVGGTEVPPLAAGGGPESGTWKFDCVIIKQMWLSIADIGTNFELVGRCWLSNKVSGSQYV